MRVRLPAAKKYRSVAEVHFNAKLWKEQGTYIAYSPELDVSSCGDSIKQAKSRLQEAASLLMEELVLQKPTRHGR